MVICLCLMGSLSCLYMCESSNPAFAASFLLHA